MGELQGNGCVSVQLQADPSRVPLSQELTLLLPCLSGLYAFFKAEGSCLQQILWLVLGPPFVPKGHSFFCFPSLFVQDRPKNEQTPRYCNETENYEFFST